MDCLQSLPARAAAFAVGVATHVVVFRHGEWDLNTTSLISSFIVLHTSAIAALLYLSPGVAADTSLDAVIVVGALGLSSCLGIWTSMLVYRGFFHRLCRFRGPFLARFSNFYVTFLSARRLHLYEEVQRLHKQYGDVVRLGMYVY
jgi:hypothetical protein